MAKSCNQKLKILYLLELLRERSQDEQMVSMQEIIDFLEEKGIQAERKSIYDDMDALRYNGLDIRYNRKMPGGYYLVTERQPENAAKPKVQEPEHDQTDTDKENRKRLKLLCERSVQSFVEQQLGRVVNVKEKDENYVILTVEQSVDARFFGWLVSMEKKVKLIKPKKVTGAFRDYLKGIVKEYKE